MKKQGGVRVSAVPSVSGKPKGPGGVLNVHMARGVDHANSARTAAAVSPAGDVAETDPDTGVTWQDLPPSYNVTYFAHPFRDGSWDIEVTGLYGPGTMPNEPEIFVLHDDGGVYVAYTQLYLNQNANVPLSGGWEIKGFDPGAFPGDLALTEIPAAPPRGVPNSAAEHDREQLSSLLGFLPVVAQVVGTVNLVQDAIELSVAERRGDLDDIADEQADLKKDLVYQILGAQQLVGVVGLASLPVVVPVVAAFFALYFAAAHQCSVDPDSGWCGVLI